MIRIALYCDYPTVLPKLKENLEKSGFAPYESEWWHYTLRVEPYPHAYFDFLPE